MNGAMQLNPMNPHFNLGEDCLFHTAVDAEMYPQFAEYDNIYLDRDSYVKDFLAVVVLQAIVLPSRVDRPGWFLYLENAYWLDNCERIGYETHFGDIGEVMLLWLSYQIKNIHYKTFFIAFSF